MSKQQAVHRHGRFGLLMEQGCGSGVSQGQFMHTHLLPQLSRTTTRIVTRWRYLSWKRARAEKVASSKEDLV